MCENNLKKMQIQRRSQRLQHTLSRHFTLHFISKAPRFCLLQTILQQADEWLAHDGIFYAPYERGWAQPTGKLSPGLCPSVAMATNCRWGEAPKSATVWSLFACETMIHFIIYRKENMETCYISISISMVIYGINHWMWCCIDIPERTWSGETMRSC